ncbi:MAG TPA: hypothetical protein VFV72_13530 [Candidatus Limnocylindrales bacterium]|nr:hypothetical protein [Candidatus Limnocylindrales bacterium]
MASLAAVGCASELREIDPHVDLAPGSAAVERDGVRVTLTIDRVPLAIGRPSEALVTIENLGADDAIYVANDCGLAVEASYRPPGDWNRVGVPQVAFAAAFKELALRGDQAAGNGPRSHLTPELFVGVESWGCRDVRLVRHLEPGATLVERFEWDAWPGTPTGPADVAATFGFIGREEAELPAGRAIEAVLPTTIVGGGGGRLGPVAAVDAALIDGPFSAFLAASPPNAWSTTILAPDQNGRVWRVGLSVANGPVAPRAYGEVTVDARTGRIVARRFDPPFE